MRLKSELESSPRRRGVAEINTEEYHNLRPFLRVISASRRLGGEDRFRG